MAEFDPDAYLAKEEKRRERTSGFDPDAYLAKTAPETAAQTFGRGVASTVDSALNALTGISDWAAYPFARAYYGMTGNRTPEQASALAQQETTSPKDVVGRAFGVTGTPGYENAPLRSAGRAIGEAVGENVIQPVASATGLPEADVGSMVSSLAMGAGPVAARAAAPIGRAARTAGTAAMDVGRGAYGAATGAIAEPGVQPKPWQQASSRVPVGEQFLPAEYLEAWRSGQMSTPEAQAAMRPSTELPAGALRATQGNVPYAGQTARAFGEQLGEVYRNPINLLTDVGLDVLTGGPIPTVGRLGYKGVQAARQAYGANKLGQYGFSAMSPEETAALSGGMPHPAVGPVNPADLARQMAASNIAPPTTPIQAAAQQAVQANMRKTPPANTMQMVTPVKPIGTIADAASDAMMQSIRNPDTFNVNYMKGNSQVIEKKHPGYQSVEISHPDGSTEIMKKHSYKDYVEYTHYTIPANGKPSPIKRSNTRPDWWSSVEDEIGKGK